MNKTLMGLALTACLIDQAGFAATEQWNLLREGIKGSPNTITTKNVSPATAAQAAASSLADEDSQQDIAGAYFLWTTTSAGNDSGAHCIRQIESAVKIVPGALGWEVPGTGNR